MFGRKAEPGTAEANAKEFRAKAKECRKEAARYERKGIGNDTYVALLKDAADIWELRAQRGY